MPLSRNWLTGFPGAEYNERKVAEGVARLMAMENVDAAMHHRVELLHEAGFSRNWLTVA